MKKIFTLFAAVMVAAMAMAETKTVTIAYAEGNGLGNGSYQKVNKELVKHSFIVDDFEFEAMAICNNPNNTPMGYAAAQFIQFQKNTGYMVNKEGVNLKSLEITVFVDTALQVYAGADMESLELIEGEASELEDKVTPYVSKEGPKDPVSYKYDVLTFDLTGKKFVKIAAVATLHIKSAVLVYDTEATAVENSEVEAKAVKVVRNGQVIIVREGIEYDLMGARM